MQPSLAQPTVVGAAILDNARQPTQLLAARRKAPKSLAGLWEFPGGKVEDGESNADGLVREVREELGVEIDLHDLVVAPAAQGWPLENGMHMHVYTAIITAGQAQPLAEHDRLEWVELSAREIHALPWIPADRPILDALLAQLAHSRTPEIDL